MNEITHQVLNVLRAVKQRRWIAVGVVWLVGVLLAVVIALIPNRYEATAKLFVDTQSVLKPLMSGLAFQPDLDQQVRMLARTLLSRPNLERLMNDRALDLPGGSGSAREKAIDALGTRIKIDHSGGNLYLISYRDSDPRRAKAVVSSLVSMFMDTGTDAKQRDSLEASRFIDEQIKSYEVKLIESENRLKEFKMRNFGTTGVSSQDYFARMSVLTEDVGRLKLQVLAAEQSRDALRRELSSEEPQLPPEMSLPANGVQQLSEVDSRLDTLRRQLDELLRRYTDEHPDVVAARRAIAQLEQQKRAETEARARQLATKGIRSSSNNPVFQRLRIAYAEAEANVASLRSQLAGQNERLEQIRATASKVPQAEAELAQLNRDYDILRKQYDQLVARRESASLGVKIDQSSNMAEYRLVEPPRVPPSAVFPDKTVLAVVAMLFALIAGFCAAFGLSLLRPTIDTQEALRALAKRPVLGTLSKHLSEAGRRSARVDMMRLSGTLGAFFVVNIAWIGFLIQRNMAAL